MGLVPFAFSVHQIVSSVGADVGFAAILGLAILVLLYFAQARETATLREQAYEAAQRVEQLEARVAQVARRQPAPAPSPASPGAPAGAIGASRIVPVPAAVGAPARAVAPAAPAGVGAPALAAATRLIPSAVPASAQGSTVAPPAPPGPAVEPDDPAEQAPVPAAGAGAGAQVPSATPIPRVAPNAAVAAPATFAGTGTGNGSPRSDAAMAGGVAARAVGRPQARAIPRTPPRRPPLGAEEPVRRSRVRLAAALLVGAAAAAAVVFVLVQLTSPGNNPSASAGGRTSTAAAHGTKPGTAFDPSKVTVAVLNGTSTLLLAGRVASRLKVIGYKQGTVTNAATQTYISSVVAFMRGHRPDALAVARSLKLKPSAVQPIDSTTQAVACPAAPCSATVVVVAGTDLASQ